LDPASCSDARRSNVNCCVEIRVNYKFTLYLMELLWIPLTRRMRVNFNLDLLSYILYGTKIKIKISTWVFDLSLWMSQMNFRAQRIWLNMDGFSSAMIDNQGHLSNFKFQIEWFFCVFKLNFFIAKISHLLPRQCFHQDSTGTEIGPARMSGIWCGLLTIRIWFVSWEEEKRNCEPKYWNVV